MNEIKSDGVSNESTYDAACTHSQDGDSSAGHIGKPFKKAHADRKKRPKVAEVSRVSYVAAGVFVAVSFEYAVGSAIGCHRAREWVK